MTTKLISVTQPNQINNGFHKIQTAEDLIVYCARVSSPNQKEHRDPTALIKYLIKHKHWSPFEMAGMCVEIETTVSVATQILRHRSFSFQQFSRRYSSEQPTFEWSPARMQGETNRQVSEELAEESIQSAWRQACAIVQDVCERKYKEAIRAGIGNELARQLLPQSLKTRLYMNGTVRSWIHYLQIRNATETQKEHREIAKEIEAIFSKEFPFIAKALKGENWIQSIECSDEQYRKLKI